MKTRHADIGYLHGLITESGTIAVAAASKTEQDQNIEHNFLAVMKDRKWKIFDVDFHISAFAAARGAWAPIVAIVGMFGQADINDAFTMHHEKLGKGKESPSRLRAIHAARCIGDAFYAVGMRRQVFRRAVKKAPWIKIDAGTFVPNSGKELAGFLSVDGFDENEIYAVGYSGEIWLFDGTKWKSLSSPTKRILQSVRCLSDGTVVACGQEGVVLRGRREAWQILDQRIADEPLTSVASLGKKTYFATEDSLIIEFDGKKFRKTKLPGKSVTTGFLDSNGKVLLSIGEEDILTYDGKVWKRLPHPAIEP